jgi:SAM-dependent methyltransferase
VSKIRRQLGTKLGPVKRLLDERNNLYEDKGVLQLEKGLLEADIRDQRQIIDNPRNFVAHHFISGKGIEVGAAQLPVKLPPGASVKYVDLFTAEELREAWPKDYSKLEIVEVDVVDDAEKLDKFKANSLDFIIANHFVEHCIDPIGTIINMYGKLRKNGVFFFAIPDKRYTFDKPRKITTYSHLIEEHKDKSNQKFRLEHTQDFLLLGDKVKKSDLKRRTKEVMDSGYRIHYHVWTQREMTEMFIRIADEFKLDLEIQALIKNQHEVIYILRKHA